ncbi:MAG: carboxypeptidase regulatory-like domain-containing protein [Sandaracinaceae bacterium]|nr:carboxypeptidase regulatory-like domain-containing protein [Sandaracinaceae bacterium]
MMKRAATLLFFLVLAWALPALADAEVVVQVRAPGGGTGEATVTLTPEGGGEARSCTTRNGTCRISGVPSGRYVVTAQPIGAGQPPVPRPVLIPPSGQVTVSVPLR